MTAVTRLSLKQNLVRLNKLVSAADVEKRERFVRSDGTVGYRVKHQKDGALNQFEVSRAARKLGDADAKLLQSVYFGALSSDGRSDTASIRDVKSNLSRAADKLLAKRNADGVVEREDVFTASGNPKRDVGNMAAKLFDSTAKRR